MSDVIPQLTQDIGIREQAAKETDPITSGDPVFYKLGLYTKSWGKYPSLVSDIVQHLRGTSFNPVSQRISKTAVAGVPNFTWANGLPFYWIMGRNGSGVFHDTGVFRIDGITSGLLNDWVVRYRSDNDLDRIQRVCIDSKISRITGSLDFDKPNEPMAGSMAFQSRIMKAIESGSGAAVSSQPGNGEQYFIDDDTKLLWDVSLDSNGQYTSGGTDLDLKKYAIEFTFAIDVITRPLKIVTQHFPAFIVNGYRLFSWHLKIRRTDETSIFDHYVGTTVTGSGGSDNSQAGLSYAGSSAFKNMHFKIFAKDSNGDTGINYIQLDLTSCAIGQLEMNHVDNTEDEEPWYDMNGFALFGVPTTKDEVDASLYGTS